MTDTALATPSTPTAPATAPSSSPAPTLDVGGLTTSGKSIQEALAALRTLPASPAGDAPASEAVAATPAPAAAAPAADEIEYTQDETGRWHRPDGTMASADEITAITASAAAPPPTADVATAGDPEPDTPASVVVALPPRNEGDAPLEIEVSDPAVAERLNQLKNNGLRRAEYQRQMAALEQDKAELSAFKAQLSTAPEVVFDQMRPEVLSRLTEHLLVTRFEELRPTIEAFYSDPLTLRSRALDLRGARTEAEAQLRDQLRIERRAAEVRGAVQALIPDTADSETAEQFMTDAVRDLSDVAAREGDVDPRRVAILLDRRLRQYGLVATDAGAPAFPVAAAGPPPALALARPTGAQAETLAARAEQAKRTVARVQRVQAQRKVAAAIAPAGVSAAAAPAEAPPKGMSIKDAATWLRQKAGIAR